VKGWEGRRAREGGVGWGVSTPRAAGGGFSAPPPVTSLTLFCGVATPSAPARRRWVAAVVGPVPLACTPPIARRTLSLRGQGVALLMLGRLAAAPDRRGPLHLLSPL
jgi:hypothetical protein